MMKNYWINIFALLTLLITSCSVNEDLVMLDEVDDIYVRPDETFHATASANTNTSTQSLEPLPDASSAEQSYYQNTPYSPDQGIDDRAAAEEKADNSDDEYYDYYDEDYASRLQNFHGYGDNGNYYSGNGNNYPVSATSPRFSWSMNYGYNNFYGPQSAFGFGMSLGNSYCNPYGMNPFYNDPFSPYGYSPYSSFCNPYASSWNRPYWGNPYRYSLSWNYYNPYYYGYPYSPYYGMPVYFDGPDNYNYAYNNQPSSRRRSRGGVVTQGNTNGSDNGGRGIVAGTGTDRNSTDVRRSESRVRTNETAYSREPRTDVSRSDYNRRTRSDVSTNNYVRTPQRSSVNTRSRVAPYTREQSTRSTRSSNSVYNGSNRIRLNGNNSFYGSPSRSRSNQSSGTSPSYSFPSRSGSSSPSRSTPSRRR